MGMRVTSAADAMAAIEIKIIASSSVENPIAFSLYKREWERSVSLKQRPSHKHGGKAQNKRQS
jgi:hypothetical protein